MNRDPEIHGLLDEIDGLLAQMPREQRLTEFERMLKPRNTDFIYENEGVHYGAHPFSWGQAGGLAKQGTPACAETH